MKHSSLNSPRLAEFRKKKQRRIKRKIILISVVFVILVLGFSFASRIPAFNINAVIVSGNSIIETKSIQDIVNNDLSGHYLWIFSKTNFLIYPKGKIKNDLVSKYKRLKDISLGIENIKTLNVTVSEYEGKYLWCGTTLPDPKSNNGEVCYFMDQNGYIFDQAPYFSGEVYFKFYGNGGENGDIPIGTYFLKDNFTEITTFKDTLEKLGLNVSGFWLDSNDEANFSFSGEPMTGPKIIFKIGADYERLAENLEAAISTEPLRTELQTKLSSLLYIDLRFNDKVYYKFSTPGFTTNSEQTSVPNAQATSASQ